MAGVMLETFSMPWALTNSTNSTATSFAARIPRNTSPSGDGLISFGHGGSQCSNGLVLVPFGVGSDTNTFSMNVWGWRALPGLAGAGGAIGNADLWIPVLLAAFTSCTLDSGLPGIAGTQEGTTALFCSAMTLAIGNSGISVEVVSPGHGNGYVAHAVVDVKGFRWAEVGFSIASGSTTSMNCLWSKV